MRAIYDLSSHFANQIHSSEAEGGKVHEAVVGIVTDNKDPQKLGRVKVKVPILSDADTTWWAPIVMSGAGKNRGWFFIPEINDEVLVIFEHGDVHRPLVVGTLWNGKDAAPDKNAGGNKRRMIKSRAGSKVTFYDDDAPKITIEDGGGKGRVTIDAQNKKIIIESLEGDVCLQAPTGEMTIVAKAITLEAKQNVEIHAGAAMAWGAGQSAKINGQSVTISGAAVNVNSGAAQMPTAPTAEPKDVDDPYGC